MTRTLLETFACSIGLHQYVRFEYEGESYRYCTCGRLQIYQDYVYGECPSGWETFVLADYVIPHDMMILIRTEIQQALHSDSYEEVTKKHKKRVSEITHTINNKIVPMLSLVNELPFTLRRTTVLDLVGTDEELFVDLLREAGYHVAIAGTDLIIGPK